MNILIIGDIMLDINNNSKIVKNAPEMDIPIYTNINTNYILGGASNVAQNLKNLGTNVEIISVIGNDIIGSKIKNLFNNKQIKHKLFIDKDRKTCSKNRIFVNNKLCVRYDIESINDVSKGLEKKIINYIVGKDIEEIDAIIISDYAKGLITEHLSTSIIDFANKNNIPTFVDPKIKEYTKYRNCFLIKPNLLEAKNISEQQCVENILKIIKNKINCENILLTLGDEGMILNTNYNKIEHSNAIDVVDVTGAGDTVLSILVYTYLKIGDLLEASRIANYVGGKSVGVIGNYSVTLDDINEYNDNIYLDKIIYDNEIDKIEKLTTKKNIVFTNGCFDILHSAHIELLKFAKKSGDILIVGLNSDNSIKRLKGETRPINDINERAKILSLFDFVDYIIIFEDDSPLNIIKTLKPNILVKGSDYTIDNIVGKEYVKNVILFNFIQNKSSTHVINKIKSSLYT
jgi:D-beta-D-heptose 7-phosphate kinase/D-beta-D-heptose 1-phosphate adenosyltransferase